MRAITSLSYVIERNLSQLGGGPIRKPETPGGPDGSVEPAGDIVHCSTITGGLGKQTPMGLKFAIDPGRNDDGRRMVARASCEADLAARIQFSKILGHTAAIMPDPIPLSEVCLFRTRAGQGIA